MPFPLLRGEQTSQLVTLQRSFIDEIIVGDNDGILKDCRQVEDHLSIVHFKGEWPQNTLKELLEQHFGVVNDLCLVLTVRVH